MKCPYGKDIHVVGIAGTEGAAVLSFLSQNYPRVKLTAHDFHQEKSFLSAFVEAHSGTPKKEAVQQAKDLLLLQNISFYFQENYLQGIENADCIFVPQSWYLYCHNAPLKKSQDKLRSITRLYFDLFPGKIIGVTGSNGKTTTTSLISKIMKNAFPSTLFSGNDRRTGQVLGEMLDTKKEDWLVLEISNRQLKIDLGKSSDISVITNITPNHLLEHTDFEEYAETKASLLRYQTEGQWSVLNWDDPQSKKLIERDDGETFPFSTKEVLPKGVFLEFGEIRLKHADRNEIVMSVQDFPLLGEHNLSNALAAIAASYLAKVPLDIIARTLRSVVPIPQRMELVGEVKGVKFYNDTASTAPESTIAALKTLYQPKKKLILIMGGKNKGLDYEEVSQVMIETVSRLILLKSPLAKEIQELIKNKIPSTVCDTLEEAVSLSKKEAAEGDIVILSPAGEYFVYFKGKMPDYKRFRSMVISPHPPSRFLGDQAPGPSAP